VALITKDKGFDDQGEIMMENILYYFDNPSTVHFR